MTQGEFVVVGGGGGCHALVFYKTHTVLFETALGRRTVCVVCASCNASFI